MSAPAAPTIPPRPPRVQQGGMGQGFDKMPDIPPRPRKADRSVSPANYPRSPFNEPYNSLSLSRRISNTDDANRRPSVQQMPSVGQEGMEYAEIQYQPNQPSSALASDAAAQTRGIDKDLKLHAPKPSLPTSSATAQVQAVTRTDSTQAASHGIGKAETPVPPDNESRQVRSRASFSRPGSSVSAHRRLSVDYEDQGPAELGMRVPINPLLGDVQAPSPAPYGLTPHHTGQSDHGKRKSVHGKGGRDQHLPPGSYGLHGHGVLPPDKFERDWYAKHPDQLQHEEGHGHGVYESIGSGRGSFALSSDDLNKIVRDTASRGAGFGASPNVPSYPDEQIGYIASEQYASRSQSGTPGLGLTRTTTNTSQAGDGTPLRKTSTAEEIDKSRTTRAGSAQSDGAGQSDSEGPVHVDDPARRYNKVTGGQESINETADVQSSITHATEEGDHVQEHGYSVPILASDEVAKENTEHMHPAISPKQERRSGSYDYDYRNDGQSGSRPSSRPNSIYNMHSASHSLSRFIGHHDDRDNLHTPLEDVDEYEPLFPEEDNKKTKKEVSTVERFKPRPDALRHRFPSQDIWEDTPSSAMYEATVSTPDLSTADMKSPTFEHPDAEAARKGEPSEEEKKKLIPNEERLAKSKYLPHLRDDMPTRPGMIPRFPSRDVWEDSPDSAHLVTTVTSPPPPEAEEEPESPIEPAQRPMIPPRPTTKSRLGEDALSNQIAPSIPARPSKPVHAVPPADAKLTEITKTPSATELRKAPSIPDRPKPQIPARPAKKPVEAPITKTLSKESADGTEGVTAKDKPSIPPRPSAGGKFASLRGNFMSDLNQKLGLGPPKEKEKEEPEILPEPKPLEDARKGRAKGPQRRAPAKATVTTAPQISALSMSQTISLWHIDDSDGMLNVAGHEKDLQPKASATKEDETIGEALEPVNTKASKGSVKSGTTSLDGPTPMAPHGLSTNIAGEDTDPTTEPDTTQAKPFAVPKGLESLSLSQKTTESSSVYTDHPLTRKEAHGEVDGAPISRQSTTSDASFATAEKVTSEEGKERKAAEESIKLRDEQVNASAPTDDNAIPVNEQVEGSEKKPAGSSPPADPEDVAVGADKPKEPMPEDDVSYKRLEMMAAKADGKLTPQATGADK